MEKNIYVVPTIEQIKIDSEITLQLESLSPPFGPNESKADTPESGQNQSPFRDTIA